MLYADVLFFVNFAMDFVSLYICAKLLHLKVVTFRFILSSLLGGVWGVVSVLLLLSPAVSFIINVIISYIMLKVAFVCPGVIRSIKYTAVLWGVGALIAGGVTLVCSLGGDTVGAAFSKGQSSFFILAVAVFAVLFLVRFFVRSERVEGCDIILQVNGREVACYALVDSGNLVADPISGLPVIFLTVGKMSLLVGKNDCEKLLSGDVVSLGDSLKKRLCVLSVTTAAGEAVVYGIKADSVTLCINKEKKMTDAVIAVREKTDFGGRGAVVPLSLVV